VFDGSTPYLDFNGSGQLQQRYLTNPNGLNQFYGQVSASGTTEWYMTDMLGSVRQVVSTSGSVLDAITYDPYGNLHTQTNSTYQTRFGFAGGALDGLTGDYQFWARDYNPADGRFLSQDPMGFGAGDADVYRYVFNSPVAEVDPSGMDFWSTVKGGDDTINWRNTGNALNNIPPLPTSGPPLDLQVDTMMQQRARMAAMGQNPPPLMWGNSVPAYGSDGNQTFAGAMGQGGQAIVNMSGQVATTLATGVFLGPWTAIDMQMSMFGEGLRGAQAAEKAGGCPGAGNAVFGQAQGNGLPWSWAGAGGGALSSGSIGAGIGYFRGGRSGKAALAGGFLGLLFGGGSGGISGGILQGQGVGTGGQFLGGAAMGIPGGIAGGLLGGSLFPNTPVWQLGSNHTPTQWANDMATRGWTPQQITEAMQSGQRFPAPNMINPANGAWRFVHPTTGQSIVVDRITNEVIHVGGPGFLY
jgi:RHS repeat-associated protein